MGAPLPKTSLAKLSRNLNPRLIGISIFLIGIGIVFLLDNLGYVNISITQIIKIYWPVILIWMGIEKLIREALS